MLFMSTIRAVRVRIASPLLVWCVTMTRSDAHLAPQKVSIGAGEEPSLGIRGRQWRPRCTQPDGAIQMEPARGSSHGTSAAKRSALKLAEDEGSNL
jgi:hypothetical protein